MNQVRNILATALSCLLLLAWFDGTLAQGAITPVNLRTALRTNPLGIEDTAPRLTWQLQNTGATRGETQTAYQVQVGSTSGAADVWDSGKVTSSDTVDVLYAGQPLLSGKKYYFVVA